MVISVEAISEESSFCPRNRLVARDCCLRKGDVEVEPGRDIGHIAQLAAALVTGCVLGS